MQVLQHYYTSYVNRETGSAGFQVKAMSPGISPDNQSTITRLISYRIPTTLNELEIANHPIALRYYYKNPQEAILLCSQSNGTDENGRPGNFFAHSLITEPDFFANMPPILYWRSRFWRTKDSGTNAVIAPLHSLEEVETTLDIEEVWKFLAQGKRIEQFHKLMCAIVHSHSTQRRIVIIDSANNVAQWIAAVTFMLPPDCRPLLSFATYHHDPYQSQFMITGTTSDSSFRASPEEYMSYFILNTVEGKMSEVAPSPYADEARLAARSFDTYEARLISLFTNYLPRFPHLAHIDEQLDLLALYAGLLEPQHSLTLTSDELKAASVALTTFEQMRTFSQTDLNELQQLGTILQEASEKDAEADKEYRRVIVLQRKHKMPTEQAALKELKLITRGIIEGTGAGMESVLLRCSKMRQTYGEDIFLATINSATYQQWLSLLPENDKVQAAQVVRVWQYIGPFLSAGQSQRFVLSSLRLAGTLWGSSRKEADDIFNTIIEAIKGQEKAFLRVVVDSDGFVGTQFMIFYCKLVTPFGLEQRLPYRDIVRRVHSEIEIEIQELYYEIGRASSQEGLHLLEQWMNHARRLRLSSLPALLDTGLKRLLTTTQKRSPQQVHEIASQILMSRILAPLPEKWENQFVDIVLARVSLNRYTQTNIEMCTKYRNREGLSPDIRTVMDGLLAMSSGELNQGVADRLYQRFSRLPLNQFEAEAQNFIRIFLSACKTRSSHQLMINALLLPGERQHVFWQAYWEAFGFLLANSTTQALELLSYWFKAIPGDFNMPYILHLFFLTLPQQLQTTRGTRGFTELARSINAQAEKQKLTWYPLVQEHFAEKNKFAAVGQNLAAQLQKRLVTSDEAKAQAEKELQARTTYEAHISALFENKRLRSEHGQMINEVYETPQRSLFWSTYWQNLKSLLASKDADKSLELMTFWFDDSFEVFKQNTLIPAEFFIGLYGMLEEARKERGFRENARQIFVKATKQPKTYQWFGLVEDCFEEPERKFNLFRRG